MTKIPNVDRMNNYQIPQMVSTDLHSTLHDSQKAYVAVFIPFIVTHYHARFT